MGQTKICRYCGNVLYKEDQTCEFCGKYLLKPHDNPDLVCEKCKSPVNTDDNFCQKCGAIFSLPEYTEPLKGNSIGIRYNIGILLTSLAASIAATVFASSGKDSSFDFVFFSIAFVGAEVFFYIYFLPSILAIEKNNPKTLSIYIFNLLLGITVIGWIVSLILALNSKPKEKV